MEMTYDLIGNEPLTEYFERELNRVKALMEETLDQLEYAKLVGMKQALELAYFAASMKEHRDAH